MNMEQIHMLLGKKVFDVSDVDQTMIDAYNLNITV
jgi:hypothetical protein